MTVWCCDVLFNQPLTVTCCKCSLAAPVVVQADIQLNRKVLSELAMHEPRSFKALADLARTKHAEAQQGLRLLLD